MIYDWFKIFNATEFLATGLVSRSLTVELEGIGEKTFLIARGNLLSMSVDDYFLPVQLNGLNPFEFEDRAVFIDGSADVFFGVKVEV